MFGLASPDKPKPPDWEYKEGKQKQTKLQLVSTSSGSASSEVTPYNTPPGQLAMAAESALAVPAEPPNQDQMLQEIYGAHKAKTAAEEKKKNWKSEVPSVNVKDAYIAEPTPASKRMGTDFTTDAQDPSQRVTRASWPKKFKKDKVEVEDFEAWLKETNRGVANAGDMVRGVNRVLGCLDVGPPPCGGEPPAKTDVKVLIGLFLGQGHKAMLALPLLHPRISWTETTFEGLVNYITYWKAELKNKKIKDDDGAAWDMYKDCLECLATELRSGYAKRCREWREIGYAEKAKEDMKVLRAFPSFPEILQPAVREAYCLLRQISTEYKDQSVLPPKVRVLANCIIVGCWHYDTYLGRKWELEHCHYKAMEEALADDQEYIICRRHKTYKTYGDLIKYLTPGLREALRAYMSLPRPEGYDYLLVPVRITTEVVSARWSLDVFNKTFVRKRGALVSPRTNHIRKLFHNKLMELTKDQESCKELLRILDAHGRNVMDKHYLITTPEDDLACAKVLVEKVIGETVAWPTEDEAARETRTVEEAVTEANTGTDLALADAVEDSDPDDEPDEVWDFGSLFGIYPPGHLHTVAIADVEPEPCLALVSAPADDVEV